MANTFCFKLLTYLKIFFFICFLTSIICFLTSPALLLAQTKAACLQEQNPSSHLTSTVWGFYFLVRTQTFYYSSFSRLILHPVQPTSRSPSSHPTSISWGTLGYRPILALSHQPSQPLILAPYAFLCVGNTFYRAPQWPH